MEEKVVHEETNVSPEEVTASADTQADEVVTEVEESVETETPLTEEQQQIVSLTEENHTLKTQVAELENKQLRTQADFDNINRRRNAERDEEKKYRALNTVQSLLPVLDNFERALLQEVSSDDALSLRTGIEMVYRQLQDALKNEGLEAVESLNAEFDPMLHQAVMNDSRDDVATNIITEELQKGYKLKDRLIRPAMVKVNQ